MCAQVALTLRRGSARCAGVLLRAWLHTGPAGGAPAAAAVVVDWQRGTLEVRNKALIKLTQNVGPVRQCVGCGCGSL